MVSTFYLSRVLGNDILAGDDRVIGRLQDLLVDLGSVRPRVIAGKVLMGRRSKLVEFSDFAVLKKKEGEPLLARCGQDFTVRDLGPLPENTTFLASQVMDRQIVDMDGRKVVRVNDLRLAVLPTGTFLVAVDVGVEGILRRLGILAFVKKLFRRFGKNVPTRLIPWDAVEAVGRPHADIKLARPYAKLSSLHPSDLADILEELDRDTRESVFASLDEEKAADVLEELEPEVQVNLLKSIPVPKAADILEEMPADEVADILEEIGEDTAQDLLGEMEPESSEEVRELMEYPPNTVGSLMATDFISFRQSMTVGETLAELRRLKPEPDSIYYLYVLNDREHLVATVSLRDLVISELETHLQEIMNKTVIAVRDTDRVDSLAEIITKYSLLALPVIDEEKKLVGTVVIDDVVYTLMHRKKRRL
jgi:CBS domain-containing protein